jgi:photosystem II stability/assembly factor-like uncharacterized protein
MSSRKLAIATIVSVFGLAAAGEPPSGSFRWDRQRITSRLTDLAGISGVSSSDVFVVGARGTVLHFDGTRWKEQKSGTSRNLSAVRAISPSDVFAVGFDGLILHFDGKEWRRQESGTTRTLSAIWGDSPSNVVAVGRSGKILRYDGKVWRAEQSGTRQDLLAVWGSSSSDIYAGGARATLLHFRGDSWSPVQIGLEQYSQVKAYVQFNALGGTSPTDAYAAGWQGHVDVDVDRTGVFLHSDGQTWKAVPEGDTELVSSLWAASPTEVFLVGRTLNGLNDVRRFDGARLSTVLSDARFGIRSAVWSALNGEVFVVGEGGSVFHGVPGPP